LRRGVAGRDDLPAEVGGAGPKGRRQGGNLIPIQKDIAAKPDQSVYLCFDRVPIQMLIVAKLILISSI
jgi:hypothetical protein